MSGALCRSLLAAEAWAELVACRTWLRARGFPGAEAFLRRELRTAASGEGTEAGPEPLLRAFSHALRAQPGTPGCLPRAVALRRFLRRHGHPGALGLGLRREGDGLRGHAWVEVGGRIVSGDEPFVRSFQRLQTVEPKGGPDERGRRSHG